MVAIKRIESVFCDSREAARTIREVQLLRHFRDSSHVRNLSVLVALALALVVREFADSTRTQIVQLLDIIHSKDLNNLYVNPRKKSSRSLWW